MNAEEYKEYLRKEYWKETRDKTLATVLGLESHAKFYEIWSDCSKDNTSSAIKRTIDVLESMIQTIANAKQTSILDQMKAELVSYLPDIEGKIRLTNVSDKGVVTAMAADTAICTTFFYHAEQCLALLKQKWPWITHIKLRKEK